MTCILMCCASHHSTTLQVSGPSKMLLFELSGEICEAVSAAVVLAAQPRALSPQKGVQ